MLWFIVIVITCRLSLRFQGGEPTSCSLVSKENYLGPDDKIRYFFGLKGPIFIL